MVLSILARVKQQGTVQGYFTQYPIIFDEYPVIVLAPYNFQSLNVTIVMKIVVRLPKNVDGLPC